MDDEKYAEGIATIRRADLIRDNILREAVRRDEAYTLHAWYYHSLEEWPFLTLGEAVYRAQDDCSPVKIVGPGGVEYDPDGGPLFLEPADG